MNEDDYRKLLEAGFTAEEFRSIATDIQFAAIAAEETGRAAGVKLPAIGKVKWTPEKSAAFHEFVRKSGGRIVGPEDPPDRS